MPAFVSEVGFFVLIGLGLSIRYIRHSFKHLMRNVKKKEGSKPETYVDIDGVGECVDTFRGMGLTEARCVFF